MPTAETAQAADFRTDIIKPLPSQRQWLDAMYETEYLLIGGQAGPGKSYHLRWAALEFLGWCFQHLGLRDVTVGLFCEDYPALKDRQITKIKREVPPWLAEIRETASDGLHVGLAPAYGGGKVALRNLDDPSKYASAEFAAVFVDELTKNPRQTFDDLRFRKRWPGVAHSPFVAASNPGSRGHAWVKKLWIDRDFSGEDARLDPNAFRYLPARGRDNPYLPESYWATLESLPDKMRAAMLDGNWDLFTGQFFSDWDRALHVCEPFAIPKSWRRRISIDYGYAAPSSVGWWALDGEGGRWRYRELYRPGLTYAALAQEVLERTPLDEPIERVVSDPAVWGDRAKTEEAVGKSGGEVFEEVFGTRGWTVLRGNHDRLQGWQRCRERLKPFALPDGRRGTKLHVFSTCQAFIRTIPALCHDEHRPEDLETDAEDHCADEWRYDENTDAAVRRDEDQLRRYEEAAAEAALAPAHGGYGFR